jgi:hypothetical protein
MRRAILLAAIFAILAGIFIPALAADPYNHQVRSLYAQPDGNSKVVYNIPIEVRMLDVSDDANWYKVKIQFNFGLASFNFAGWAYIPVGQILTERSRVAVNPSK